METNDAKIYRTRILQFFRDDVYSSKALDTSKMGLLFFAVATIAFGIQNFIFGDFVMGRAPAWPSAISGKLVWAYTSGVMFVTFGVAIVIGKRSVMAAISIAVLVFAWALLRHFLLRIGTGALK